MSVPTEQLDPVNLKRDEWVRRHLGYQVQSQQLAQTVGKAMDTTRRADLGEDLELKPDDGQRGSRRKLMERLKLLKLQALPFAELAPPEEYAPVADLIAEVGQLIEAERWQTAHGAIQRATQLIDTRTPVCRELHQLQGEIAQLTLELDKLAGVLLPDELGKLDQALIKLEAETTTATLAASRNTLAALALQLKTAHDEAETRVGRVQLLHEQRAIAAADAKRLATRAESLQLDDVAQQARKQRENLKALEGSTDEAALKLALEQAGEQTLSWQPALDEADRLLAIAGRQAQLDDLDEQRRQLEADNSELMDSAIPTLAEDVTGAIEAFDEQLKEGPDAENAVDRAQVRFEGLQASYSQLKTEMDKIAALQRSLGPKLLKYEAEDDDALDEAYEAIPEGLKDPESDGWATDPAWDFDASGDDWHPRDFLKAWAKKQKLDVAAQATEDYEEMKARYPGVRQPLQQLLKKASPDQQQRAKAVLLPIDQLLVVRKQTTLIPSETKLIEAQFTLVGDLVEEIKTHIAKQRKAAKDIDDDDGGHSVARHGPDITDAALGKRLTTGTTPEGKFSPAEKSSRFNSYDDLLFTREAAFDDIADAAGLTRDQLFGAALDQAPNPNAHGARKRAKHTVTVDHSPRVIGEGFIGRPPGTPFPTRGQKFAAFDPLPPLTSTYTRIVWEQGKGKWVVVQHFPTDV